MARNYIAVLLLAAGFAGHLVSESLFAEASQPENKKPSIQLKSGGQLTADLFDCDQQNVVRCQGEAFSAPFEFAVDAVQSISFPVAFINESHKEPYCLELAGGNVLFGSLADMTDKEVAFDTARFGRVNVRRDQLVHIYGGGNGSDLVYVGPHGLMGWRTFDDKNSWKDDGGHLITNIPSASIAGDCQIPARAAIDFEVSWKNKGDFILGLAVNPAQNLFQQAFRFEVWNDQGKDQLVVYRETNDAADLAMVQELPPGAGRARLTVYLDQEKGRLLAYSPEGKQLADLHVPPSNQQIYSGIRLTNKTGDLRLERLHITRWNGETPAAVQVGESRVHRTDGTIIMGTITGYDSKSKQFRIRSNEGESLLDEAKFASALFPIPDSTSAAMVRVLSDDRTVLTGDLIKVKDQKVWLQPVAIREALPISFSEIHSIVSVNVETAASPAVKNLGTLKIEGATLPGHLENGRQTADASCLVWQPQGSTTASPLKQNISGRIVYRTPAPPPPQVRRAAAAPPPNAFQGFLKKMAANAPEAVAQKKSYVHLQNGNVIPSEIIGINEQGVQFRTSHSTATFAAHHQIKAIDFGGGATLSKLPQIKRERLLTLPRLQKNNPPTHLISSLSGDFLRGRLLSLDDKTLTIEVRLEKKEISRDRVARIVWLHPDMPEDEETPTTSNDIGLGTRLQSLNSDGTRLTFIADRVEGVEISGQSEVLGDCRIDIEKADELLFGGEIDKYVQQLVYHQFKLTPAIEPIANNDSGEGDGGMTGTESAMVGKMAPDFTLEMLEGSKFHLADFKGKVVVLDFWASWCGPCLQSMPQVERAVRSFDEADVQLMAIDMEELPAQVRSAMERHKMQMQVALDRDGVVAQKYEVGSIPQTVVIDREGKVARLYVGDHNRFEEQLREALQDILGVKPKDSPEAKQE